MKEAALRLAFRLYGGNRYDTGHSTDPAPTAAMAEQQPLEPSASAVRLLATQQPPLTGPYAEPNGT
jgi:hypothetical protein